MDKCLQPYEGGVIDSLDQDTWCVDLMWLFLIKCIFVAMFSTIFCLISGD